MTKLVFTTTGNWPTEEGFGCASLGLAGKCDNKSQMSAQWPLELEGTVFTGRYSEVLRDIAGFSPRVNAAIILFGNAGGENQFMKSICEILSCPMVGGGAAIDAESNRSALITGNGEVAVFLITDDRFDFHAETQCIHDHILGTCSLVLEDPRTIISINGKDAVLFLKEIKEKHGISVTDFEHLTLSDMHNINAHLSYVDGKIRSGRDLDEKMLLRYVSHACVYERMRAFYDDPDAIIFGCAGLSGLLDKPLDTNSLGLFLFGEVCTVGQTAFFGNLMLSKLSIRRK